ncbi:hypothetical protein ABBQ38_006534 [Trebouxia sp. C0009 RCD-2024]
MLFSVCALVCLESAQSHHAVQRTHAGKAARRLQQSALKINVRDPVSATAADLVDDPTGRGHLQEAELWAANESPSIRTLPTFMCAPNTGRFIADPSYDNPTYQIMSAQNYSLSPALMLTILLQSWPINSYPFLAQLPQGLVLIIAGDPLNLIEGLLTNGLQTVCVFDPATQTYKEAGFWAANESPSIRTPPTFMCAPNTGRFIADPILQRRWSHKALIAGGSDECCASSMSAGGPKSWLFDVSPGADHSLIEEALSFPRVMGELTLLPDGRVFLWTGAQIGIAGGAGSNEDNANEGTTVGEIYDPSKPVGQR